MTSRTSSPSFAEPPSQKPIYRLRSIFRRIKSAHVDDGTDDFTHHPHRKKRLAHDALRQAHRDEATAWRNARLLRQNMRTVSAEDRILERGANPRTGMVSPFTPSVAGGTDYIGDSVPMAGRKNTMGVTRTRKRTVSDGRWRQNSSGWNIGPPTPGPALTPPAEEALQVEFDGSARPTSIQDLQDRFVVHMPGADDPAPKNMSDAQIRKYQRAVSMVARAGGEKAAILLPKEMTSHKKDQCPNVGEIPKTRPHKIPRKSVGSGSPIPVRTTGDFSPNPPQVEEGSIDWSSSVEYHALTPDQPFTPPSNPCPSPSRPAIKRQACSPRVPQIQQRSAGQRSKVSFQEDASENSATVRQKKLFPRQPNHGAPHKRTSASEQIPHNLKSQEEAASVGAGVTQSPPTLNRAQSKLVNRAKVQAQPLFDEGMLTGFPLFPQQWFKGHWTDNNDGGETKSTGSFVQYPATAEGLGKDDDDAEGEPLRIAAPTSGTTARALTHTPNFTTTKPILIALAQLRPGIAVSHTLDTLISLPAALRLLSSSDRAEICPKAYLDALKRVILGSVYLLIALRMMSLMAEALHAIGKVLRWGWVLVVGGMVLARWYAGGGGISGAG